MKSSPAPERQQNSLAQFISDLPILLRIHVNKVLIGVIALCAVILLVRHRMSAAEQERLNTRASLSRARQGIEQLAVDELRQGVPPADRIRQRRSVWQEVTATLDQVMAATSDSDEANLRAEALAAQGDLYWLLAGMQPVEGAATQPALAMPQSPQQYLDESEAAYLRILKDYPTQTLARVTALLGLAAIDENRGHWDKAIDSYNKLTTDDSTPDVFKRVARQRLGLIPQLRTPVYIGSYSTTQPTTEPAAMIEPTSAPATQSAATSPAAP